MGRRSRREERRREEGGAEKEGERRGSREGRREGGPFGVYSYLKSAHESVKRLSCLIKQFNIPNPA